MIRPLFSISITGRWRRAADSRIWPPSREPAPAVMTRYFGKNRGSNRVGPSPGLIVQEDAGPAVSKKYSRTSGSQGGKKEKGQGRGPWEVRAACPGRCSRVSRPRPGGLSRKTRTLGGRRTLLTPLFGASQAPRRLKRQPLIGVPAAALLWAGLRHDWPAVSGRVSAEVSRRRPRRLPARRRFAAVTSVRSRQAFRPGRTGTTLWTVQSLSEESRNPERFALSEPAPDPRLKESLNSGV